MFMKLKPTSIAVLCLLLIFSSCCLSQEAEPQHDASDLAKQTQNPVSSVISVPFQFNFNSGGGLNDRTLFNLNFQPVIPFKLTSSLNLIARTIVPIVSVPAGDLRFSGVGDIQEQLFFSPSKATSFVFGIGPIFSFPTATADVSRTGSWAAGPNGVVLMMTKSFVFGALINQLWTFSDDGDEREVNKFLLQPFANYNFGKGWVISIAPSITADWDASDGEQWTVPVGIGI